jgi:hypothetical protein
MAQLVCYSTISSGLWVYARGIPYVGYHTYIENAAYHMYIENAYHMYIENAYHSMCIPYVHRECGIPYVGVSATLDACAMPLKEFCWASG